MGSVPTLTHLFLYKLVQIANINHLFEESDWSFNVMSNVTPPPLSSLSDDDRSALDNIKRQMSRMTDLPTHEQKRKTWLWLLISMMILLLIIQVMIIVCLVRELRVRRTRDLSTYRGSGAEDPERATTNSASPTAVGNQEDQELDISIVHVH